MLFVVRPDQPSYIPRLSPDELLVIVVRRHPAVLIGSILVALSALTLAGIDSWVIRGNGALVAFSWAVFGIAFLRLCWKSLWWANEYFIFTSSRFIQSSGIFNHKVNAISLAKVTKVRLRKRLMSRFWECGSLVLESVCFDRPFVSLDYTPYPEQLFLELSQAAFPGIDVTKVVSWEKRAEVPTS